MDRAKAHTKTAHNNKPCCTAPAAAACCCRSPLRRWKMRLPRRGSHASDAPKCGASPGGVGDVIGAMRVPQCHCCGGAAPGEILALEAVFDAIFSLELRGSCAEIAALIGNVAALRRLLGSAQQAPDGKAANSQLFRTNFTPENDRFAPTPRAGRARRETSIPGVSGPNSQ